MSSQLTSAAARTSLQETSDQETSLQDTSDQETSVQDTSDQETSLQETESQETLAFAAAYQADPSNSVVPVRGFGLRNLFSAAFGFGGLLRSVDLRR